MTYNRLVILIKNGRYDKDDMLKKMDVFLMADRITSDEYNQLVALMEEYPPVK